MKKILVIICTCLVMLSCSPKNNAPKQLEKLVDKVEAKADKFTEDEWEKVGEEYDAIVEQYGDDYKKYSSEDRQKMAELIGRYNAAVAKHAADELKGALESAGSEIEGLLKGLFGDKDED